MSLFSQLEPYAASLPEGGEMRLPPMQVAHYAVADTALAAALGTLRVPFRDPAPFTRDTVLDARGNETGRLRTTWWLDRESPNGEHKTEAILGFWEQRARFEAGHPLHPLVAMRAALDARAGWLGIMNSRGAFPTEPKAAADRPWITDSIHGASVLVACGYQPLAFSGRAFYVQRVKDGVRAEQLLQTAAQETGATPPQWMAKILHNYSPLVGIAKREGTIIQQRFDDLTVLLTADSTTRTRDRFFRAKDELFA